MKAQEIAGATRRMAAPTSWDHSKGICHTLEIIDTPAGWMVSAWRPSAQELAQISNGQPVLLWIQGIEHPVVSVEVAAVPIDTLSCPERRMVDREAYEAGKRDGRAEIRQIAATAILHITNHSNRGWALEQIDRAERAEQIMAECREAAREPLDPPYEPEHCPGHVASSHDPKVCMRCGTHIDSLRPDDGQP